MSDLGRHGEWLSLMEVSGPFLAEPVLREVFLQGLEGVDPEKRKTLRNAYDEWREAVDLADPDLQKIHRAWVQWVLSAGLELDERGTGETLKPRSALDDTIRCELPEHGIELQPDFAVVDGRPGSPPLMLVMIHEPDVGLSDPFVGDAWSGTPAERMVELCRAVGVRLGLVTNGERWMLVDVPVGGATTYASWYARLWGPEAITLQSFVNLLGVRRFFVDPTQQLPAMLDNSLKHQDDVTDALGEQVRRAVEVLIQAIDRADFDRGRELLRGIEPSGLYEAGLTVMMRIVFLLSAEERGLLALGDERYEANYAVSTLRLQLLGESEEILERRWDAWSRLLAIFRAVYGGVEHEAMRLPALGGSLFDPDRFPFLEGRPSGSRWKRDPATPLPIDNRTVLYLLDAVQLFQGRTLSYSALDVEQIGYVYEGLLERTVARVTEVTLDLDATKNAKNPWISLPELDDASADGRSAIESLLQERTGSSASRVRNDLDKPVDDAAAEKLLTACHADGKLRDRVKPYFNLLRTDRWGYPLVCPKGTFIVTTGTDRRETGTHYTPKSFTEKIVKETLEPLAYVGPSTGLSRDAWRLKSPAELLDLKICDPAMGSGAFLVQVCRWLSERVVEAWAEVEKEGKAVASSGEVVDKIGINEPLRDNTEERLLAAKRLIAERCLYGVDMNPLAVELAKLSIWLVTLAKGRPFGFLDHNLRAGDSLLGITSLDQLYFLEMVPNDASSKKLFASRLDSAVAEAVELRSLLRQSPVHDIRDVEAMANLDSEARRKLRVPEIAASALLGEVFRAGGHKIDETELAIRVGEALAGSEGQVENLQNEAQRLLNSDLPDGKRERCPFNWPLEFPEVFARANGGFDAFVGNPPFLGGQMVSGTFGQKYLSYCVEYLTYDEKASVDLVVYFFLRVFKLIRPSGYMGLLARRSIAEGRNREVGLSQIIQHGGTIYYALTDVEWPGKASVIVHQLHMTKDNWLVSRLLNGATVPSISANLTGVEFWEPQKLRESAGRAFQGTILGGEGFKIEKAAAQRFISVSRRNADVLFPFVGGSEINKNSEYSEKTWVINFWDWPEEKARTYPEIFAMVEDEVKPERQRKTRTGEYVLRDPLPQKWWQHREKQSALYHCLGRGQLLENQRNDLIHKRDKPLERVLVISTGVTKFPAFTFIGNDSIYSNKLCVICSDRFDIFGVLSSDIHGVWAWSQKTSMGADLSSLVYAHGNILETFPYPENLLEQPHNAIASLGRRLFEARQTFMASHRKGLTKFYNAFHNPADANSELGEVRDLQRQLNEAVCASYGWTDVRLNCDFHEVTYLPAGRNIRFSVDESARLEILIRLSRLNKSRFEQDERVRRSLGDGAFQMATPDGGPQSEGDLFATVDDDE